MSTSFSNKHPLRVGIISNTYAPDKNGESVAVQALEKALLEKGVEVYLAVPRVAGVNYPAHILPIKAVPVVKNIRPDLHLPYGYINSVVDFFGEKQVDIIHTHNTLMGGMEGAYIALKLEIPCIHTYHTDIESYDYWNLVPSSKMQAKNLIKIILNSYDHIIALSSKMQSHLLRLGIETPITRSHNVPFLENIIPRQSPDTDLMKELGITPSNIIVLTHGRIAKEKGVETGVEVMAEVIHKNPQVKYLIAGVAVENYMKVLKTKIDELGITNNVIFSGSFSALNLGSLASVSSIYLNTSITENHPTTPLEAMHLGLASVFINDSAFDYIAKDGVNCFIGASDELANHISLLVENSRLRAKMTRAAEKSAQEYCSYDYAQDHIKIYQSVIERFKEQEERVIERKQQQQKQIMKIFKKPFEQISNFFDEINTLTK